MPSWHEKLYVPPMINVNLKPCTCGGPHFFKGVKEPVPHLQHCPAVQVLIPYSLPHSWTVEVVLGECSCGFGLSQKHGLACPGAPIRVTCSIGGETWEESHVTNVTLPWTTDDSMARHPSQNAAETACRDRWSLVKALLLGLKWKDPFVAPGQFVPTSLVQLRDALIQQRDEALSAICDMALTQKANLEAHRRAVKAIGSPLLTVKERKLSETPVYHALEVYIDQLLEKVGVLQ